MLSKLLPLNKVVKIAFKNPLKLEILSNAASESHSLNICVDPNFPSFSPLIDAKWIFQFKLEINVNENKKLQNGCNFLCLTSLNKASDNYIDAGNFSIFCSSLLPSICSIQGQTIKLKWYQGQEN